MVVFYKRKLQLQLSKNWKKNASAKTRTGAKPGPVGFTSTATSAMDGKMVKFKNIYLQKVIHIELELVDWNHFSMQDLSLKFVKI